MPQFYGQGVIMNSDVDFLVVLERVASGIVSSITLAVNAKSPEDAMLRAFVSLGGDWSVKGVI
jgi:hypothetical protein